VRLLLSIACLLHGEARFTDSWGSVCVPDPVVMGFRTTVFINCLPWMYPPPLVKMDILISGKS
jgi:hypothetical protein